MLGTLLSANKANIWLLLKYIAHKSDFKIEICCNCMQKTVNKRITELRESLKMNKADFARLVGLSSSHLSMVEKDTSRPSFDVLHSIASKIPRLNLYWLMLGRGKMFLDTEDEEEIVELVRKPEPETDALHEGIYSILLADRDRELELYRERERRYQEKEDKLLEALTKH